MNWGSFNLLISLWALIPVAALLIWLQRRRLRRMGALIDAGLWKVDGSRVAAPAGDGTL
jgi:cyanate permease